MIVGAILLTAWASLEFTHVEEPASPGKTPNPSEFPWNVPVPKWEYALARTMIILVDYVLPVLACSAFAFGISLLCLDAGSRPGPIVVVIGALLLIAGASLIATTLWQWQVRTKPMEISLPTTPNEMDPDSPFAQDFSKWTPEKSEAYWRKVAWWDRLDRVWWRLVLYSFPPVAVLFAATGLWLLTANRRRRTAPSAL